MRAPLIAMLNQPRSLVRGLDLIEPYFNRSLKSESTSVCFSRWAQGNRKNHAVGGHHESTEGRQQEGDPAVREKKRSLQG